MIPLQNSQPLAPLATLSPTWSGFGLGGAASFFGPAAQIARGPDPGGLHYTVIPLPVMPPGDVTMARRADAFAATYAGRMEDAVDLYRLSVEADGWMDGILKTMAHGILSCPLSLQGSTPEVRSALLDADGTPGDWYLMHPDNEVAKVVSDMIGMGFGLGQYVLKCWNCGCVEWWVDRAQSDAHVDVQRCKCCKLAATARPVGQRVLYQLCWRDARWLWRNTVTNQWRYTGRQGQVDVNPGDGEWVLLQAVPDTDVWRHGPWVWGTIAAIFSRDSTFDRQLTSAVCAPTHVFQAKGGTGQSTRQDVEAQAAGLRWGNKLVLPGEWDHRIDAAKAEFVDVTAAIVEWAYTMWAVGVTGNAAAVKPATGFANLDFYAVTERTRRAFLASVVVRQLGAQGLRWYVADNWGPGVPTPVARLDTRSPSDKMDESKALEEEGKALGSLREGYDAVGYELDPAWVEERAQQKGVRIRPQARRAAKSLEWDATMQAGFVKISEARADLGYPLLGDARDDMMVTASTKPGGDKTPAGATASPPPAAPAPSSGASPAPAAAPRLEAGEDLADIDVDELDDDEIRAREIRAASMNEHGHTACRHGRTGTCPRCGVAGDWQPAAGGQWAVTWKPMRKARRAAA